MHLMLTGAVSRRPEAAQPRDRHRGLSRFPRRAGRIGCYPERGRGGLAGFPWQKHRRRGQEQGLQHPESGRREGEDTVSQVERRRDRSEDMGRLLCRSPGKAGARLYYAGNGGATRLSFRGVCVWNKRTGPQPRRQHPQKFYVKRLGREAVEKAVVPRPHTGRDLRICPETTRPVAAGIATLVSDPIPGPALARGSCKVL